MLTAIRKFFTEHGHAPTLDELSLLLDRSKPTLWGHVQELRRSGFIAPAGSNGRLALGDHCGKCGQSIEEEKV